MQLRKLKKIKLLRLAHEELGMESGRHGAVWRLSLHRLLGASHRPQAEAKRFPTRPSIQQPGNALHRAPKRPPRRLARSTARPTATLRWQITSTPRSDVSRHSIVWRQSNPARRRAWSPRQRRLRNFNLLRPVCAENRAEIARPARGGPASELCSSSGIETTQHIVGERCRDRGSAIGILSERKREIL
jgi:hypothetical protein